MKNKTIKISLFSLLFFIQIFGGAQIIDFTGSSTDGNIVLKWNALSESNLKNYVIERKTANGKWIDIATVAPKSEMSYKYTDETAYKTTTANLYVYRLRIVDNDGTFSHSGETRTLNNVSGFKKTWGSIKALFR